MTPQIHMTEAEYLDFERASVWKHEYLDGRVQAMAHENIRHNLVRSYCMVGLHSQLRQHPCEILMATMRLKVRATGFYTYPDISVVCGEAQLADEHFDTLLNPVLIIEVLSKSTEAYDRGIKFQHYRQLESLQEYLLIAQDQARIERFERSVEGQWLLSEAVGLDSSLELHSIPATLSLAEVYEKVRFDEAGRSTNEISQE